MSVVNDTPTYNSFALSLQEPDAILYAKRGFTLFNYICMALAILATCARVWVRYLATKWKFTIDDLLAIAALPLGLGMMISMIKFMKDGVGMHTQDVPLEDLVHTLILNYIGQLLFILLTSSLRFSVLYFYSRIFPLDRVPDRWWVYFYYATVGVAMIWTLFITLFDTAFACAPPAKYWYYYHKSYHGTCVPMSTIYYIEAIGSALVNLMVLILPLPQVFKLNMHWAKKVGVCFSFLLGYGIAFESIGRLVMCFQLGNAIDYDPMYFLVAYLYWTTAQVGLSIVAVDLPAIFQLWRRGRMLGFKSLFDPKAKYITPADVLASASGNAEVAASLGLLATNNTLEWDNIYEGNPFFGTQTLITAGNAIGRDSNVGSTISRISNALRPLTPKFRMPFGWTPTESQDEDTDAITTLPPVNGISVLEEVIIESAPMPTDANGVPRNATHVF